RERESERESNQYWKEEMIREKGLLKMNTKGSREKREIPILGTRTGANVEKRGLCEVNIIDPISHWYLFYRPKKDEDIKFNPNGIRTSDSTSTIRC
ncbi:hypothetical protein Ahia01_000631000, partial [Argonauta hians]